ncbi:SDR family oxidoreductase [Mycobacterium sp. smrl_JER01]|uniref:SDR family oxidoreductase n=1 Tax=Mycobacterium sp. smrl_JER01 TaxID=3402633 RepID=UPI003AD61397
MSIHRKVVAVTGGARGIGLATATLLARLGGRVAIGDVDGDAVDAAGHALGLEVFGALDVTQEASFTAFLDRTEQTLGPIDVLVNNAGIIAVGPALDEPTELTQRLIAVNISGVILGTKLAAARMRRRGSGHVINIASASAVMPVPGIATYSATKHAVLGFTDAVRLENRRTGVHFSTVMPALTNTDMVTGIGRARGIKNIEPEDVAAAVAGLIRRPRPRVMVPRTFGAIALTGRRLLPRPAYESLERALGAERVFQDSVDPSLRTAYERRIRNS